MGVETVRSPAEYTFSDWLSDQPARWRAFEWALEAAYEAGRNRAVRLGEGCPRPCCIRDVTVILTDVGLHNVGLTERESDIVGALLTREGRVVGRKVLARAVWGPEECEGEGHLIRIHLVRIRPKLGTAGWCVDTLSGIGYRLHRTDDTACLPKWNGIPRQEQQNGRSR